MFEYYTSGLFIIFELTIFCQRGYKSTIVICNEDWFVRLTMSKNSAHYCIADVNRQLAVITAKAGIHPFAIKYQFSG